MDYFYFLNQIYGNLYGLLKGEKLLPHDDVLKTRTKLSLNWKLGSSFDLSIFINAHLTFIYLFRKTRISCEYVTYMYLNCAHAVVSFTDFHDQLLLVFLDLIGIGFSFTVVDFGIRAFSNHFFYNVTLAICAVSDFMLVCSLLLHPVLNL
jgi:hypothetical protein